MDFRLDELKSAMVIQTKKNEVVANNLANADTIGFKKDFTFFDTYHKELEDVNNLSIQAVKDFSQGDYENTNNPLDLAINGEGFFNIQSDNEVVYSRNGHFDLDINGNLVDSAGNFVLGEQGTINLLTTEEQVSNIYVSGEGEIYVDDVLVDRIKVTNFIENTQMERLSGSTFRLSNPSMAEEEESTASVLQGRIEKSNVNPITEMVNLMELERGFQSSQRTIKILDDILNKAATQLSKV